MREKPKDINRLSHIIEAIDNLFEVTKGISFDGYKGNKTLRLPYQKFTDNWRSGIFTDK